MLPEVLKVARPEWSKVCGVCVARGGGLGKRGDKGLPGTLLTLVVFLQAASLKLGWHLLLVS